MTRRRTGPMTLCAGAAVLALGACGSAPKGAATLKVTDEQQVRTVIARFEQATQTKDYDAICHRLLAPQLTQAVERYGRPCESIWKRNLTGVVAPRLKVESVNVIGAAATAEVSSQAIGQDPAEVRLAFVRYVGGWRISNQR